MAIIDQAQTIADKYGIDADAVTTYRRGGKTLIKVSLPNGREIVTDHVDGWETTLEKNIKRFINKK